MMNDSQYNKLILQTIKSSKITRLIAQENISVQYSDTASTAYFTPATRTITYPYSMAMEDDNIHMLFIFHEVGHAIFSKNDDLFKKGIQDGISDEFNITEDIRIEKLIKFKYPGIIKDFNLGYEKLLNKEFFGPINRINLLSFANRLNIYAKVGPITGKFIKFSREETEFYNRCIAANTEQESFDLAVELANNFKQSNQDIIDSLKDMMKSGVDIGEEFNDILNPFNPEEDSEEDDSDFEQASSHSSEKKELTEEDYEEIADRVASFRAADHFKEEFSKTAIKNCSVISYEKASKNIIDLISSKEYSNMVFSFDRSVERVRNFKKSCDSSIDYMVREFEAKKAAYRNKHTKISDTGLINVNRIVNYKYSNDVFSQVRKIGDAKNHGFVILLDCSASIKYMYQDMVEQTIVLVEFFRKIGVKYKVYGYGMEIRMRGWEAFSGENHSFGFKLNEKRPLIEFLNSEQNNADSLKNMVGMINRDGFSLGNTPTVNAFAQIEYLANDFFNGNRIQIKKIINITDGEPNDYNYLFSYSKNGKDYGKKCVVIDPDTKKNYMVDAYPYAPIDAIGAVFRDRYDISLVSLAIVNGNRNYVNAKDIFVGKKMKANESKEFVNAGYAKFTSSNGNDVFVVKSSNVDNDLTSLDVSSTDTNASITSKFKKKLAKNMKSKNFLLILSQYLSVA